MTSVQIDVAQPSEFCADISGPRRERAVARASDDPKLFELAGEVYRPDQYPSAAALVKEKSIGLVVPMSIDWAQAPWAEDLLAAGAPIFSPPF